MDASIATAIIGVLGAALVGALGFIFTMLRAEIRTNGEDIRANGERVGRLGERVGGLGERVGRLGERVGGLEERVVRFEERTFAEFGQIRDVLARIEATQAEQGRQLEKLSGGDLP